MEIESSSTMALHSLLEDGDLGEMSRLGKRGVVSCHQLLYHLCQHVGAEHILAPDPQRLMEALHGIGEVPSQSLHVAKGGVDAGLQGRREH